MKKKDIEHIAFCFMYLNWQKQQEQADFREGNIVPVELEMNIFKDSGIFFGRMKNGDLFVGKLAYIDGHILIVGFPGSGKTMAIVIPTMMTWKGIQIIIDVKGIFYKIRKKLNKDYDKKVFVFSPCKPGDRNCYFDPYVLLRSDGYDKLAGNALDLAFALIPLTPLVIDPIWIEIAQFFLASVIIFYFDLGCTFMETLVAIKYHSITEMIDKVMDSDNMIAKMFMGNLKGVQGKVVKNIGLELTKLASMITSPEIINAFLPHNGCNLLDWADINTANEPFDVILEIPEANLERWKPMTVLMINQLIKCLEKRSERTYNAKDELPPVLVLLDEFARLGKIPAITEGLATLRSRGVTFVLIIQSLAKLEEIYGTATARVITDICSYKVVLGVSDPISQEYFSKAVGTIENTQKGASINFNPFSGIISGFGINFNDIREPIIQPQEFLPMNDVVIINPFGFCRVDKVLSFENEEMFFGPQSLQNQDYAESSVARQYKEVNLNNFLETSITRVNQLENERKMKMNREKKAREKKEDSRNFKLGELVSKYFPDEDIVSFENLLRALVENTEVFTKLKDEAAKYALHS
ncbi:MAG: type IV secretory system conjugative DNA transfer family protein [Treponema sp.]|nr:type IV secretory system conjugative DNA transfer family protein [Treponema sp.]